ncbi:hypothetical protein ACFLYR_08530 [Chloroflexota bacterium]
MKANIYDAGYDEIAEREESEVEAIEKKRCAERIWNAITKYVTFDKDAIFKDPDWPHLWDHKR